MSIKELIRRIPRIPHRIYWEVRSWIFPLPKLLYFWLANRFRKSSVVGLDGLVVSLTSYGKRLRTVYLTIESIAAGRILPSRIILWIDDEATFQEPPATIQRLVARGLELRLCHNYGPHKKYFPYLQSHQTFDVPLITADDDVFYPSGWMEGFVLAFQERPREIHCYRAHTMRVTPHGIGKYEEWGIVRSTDASFGNVATGVAGVLYPPEFLPVLKGAGDRFLTVCPRSDDLWLHVQAIRAGYKIRQIRPEPLLPLSIPGAEGVGLWKSNIFGGNDVQIANTYTAQDIRMLVIVND